MRLFFTLLVCKAVKLILKLLGRGSSMPGLVALKLYPDILEKIKLPQYIIAVTGSNGKTSTVEMIAQTLNHAGKKVIWNKEGSNQIAGVATSILSHCTMGGKVKADALLIESDERYAKYTFSFFSPTHYVITNLYRDQLTRNAHPEWVFNALKPSVHSESTLILNADDPLVSCFAENMNNVVWFGMDRQEFSTDKNTGIYDDGRYCPMCKGIMEYDYYHYNHIGSYHCTNCGHKKENTAFTVTRADLDKGIITINNEYDITLAFKSIYNVYNILACFAVCSLVGIDKKLIAESVSDYVLKNGRVVKYRLGNSTGTFLISKHENSVSYDRSLDYVIKQNKPCEVIVIVDAVSRRYTTGETSWLWDIDFDMLKQDCIKRVWLLGKHAEDLKTRISFTDTDMNKVTVNTDIEAACKEIASRPACELYTITCFSDKNKFLSMTEIL